MSKRIQTEKSNTRCLKNVVTVFSGVTQRAYFAGQDSAGHNNTIDILLDENTIKNIGIYVNKTKKSRLFKVGHKTETIYALDELKPGGEYISVKNTMK